MYNQTQQVFTIDVDKFINEIQSIPHNMTIPYTYPMSMNPTGNTQQDMATLFSGLSHMILRQTDEKIKMALTTYHYMVMNALRDARVSNSESLCGLCRPMPGETPCQS